MTTPDTPPIPDTRQYRDNSGSGATRSPLIDQYLRFREPGKPSKHTTRRYGTELAAIASIIAAARGLQDAAALDADWLTPAAVSDAFATYAGAHSRSTVAGCWSTWQQFCLWLIRAGLLMANPMDHIPRPTVPHSTPKALAGGSSTVDRLLTSIQRGDRPARNPWPARDLAVVGLYACTGVRRAEGTSLNIVDRDHADSGPQLRVTGKGGKQRWVPYEEPLDYVLDAYLAERIERFPPRTRSGEIPTNAPLLVDDRGERMTGDQLYYLIRECYRAAGVLGQVPRGAMVHALRHLFATGLAEHGAAATDIQELLGHGSLATSQRYVHVTGARLREVVRHSPATSALARTS